MKRFEVTAISTNFTSGVLQLTDEQYKSRAHLLTPIEGEQELYQLNGTGPVQFKKGEVVGFDGEINKAHLAEFANQDGSPIVQEDQVDAKDVNTDKTSSKKSGKGKGKKSSKKTRK